MADGPFYVDTRQPILDSATPPAVTLTTTLQILASGAYIPQLPPYYFNWVGKAVRVRCDGVATSGATPGALDFQFQWGPATSNTGVLLCGVSLTWTASVTAATFVAEAYFRCRATGTSGSLFCMGQLVLQNTGIVMLPPTAPAAIPVDLSQSYYIIPQVSRSGSTAETIQMLDYSFEALN